MFERECVRVRVCLSRRKSLSEWVRKSVSEREWACVCKSVCVRVKERDREEEKKCEKDPWPVKDRPKLLMKLSLHRPSLAVAVCGSDICILFQLTDPVRYQSRSEKTKRCELMYSVVINVSADGFRVQGNGNFSGSELSRAIVGCDLMMVLLMWCAKAFVIISRPDFLGQN